MFQFPMLGRLLAVFAALFALFLAADARAQTTGDLDGHVTADDADDPGPIEDVTVTITSPALIGGAQVLETDVNGYFHFTQLVPGVYAIRCEKGGFRGANVSAALVSVGSTAEADVKLKPGWGDRITVANSRLQDLPLAPIPRETDGLGDTAVQFDLSWVHAKMTLELTGFPQGVTGFEFGVVEAGRADGWRGEDCAPVGQRRCHGFSGTSGSLSRVHRRARVVLGRTTLFDGYGRLTYVLLIKGGDCYVWGDDPLYYAAYSCHVLSR